MNVFDVMDWCVWNVNQSTTLVVMVFVMIVVMIVKHVLVIMIIACLAKMVIIFLRITHVNHVPTHKIVFNAMIQHAQNVKKDLCLLMVYANNVIHHVKHVNLINTTVLHVKLDIMMSFIVFLV